MTQTTKTASQLITEFLADRAGRVVARTVARDREVMDRLHVYLDANGPVLLDEQSAQPLPRAAGGVGLSDLVDVELIIMNWREFVRDGIRPHDQTAMATLRQFALWLRRVGELDPCGYLEMHSCVRGTHPAGQARWPERR